MSAKWVRSKAWDDRVFPRWAWPIKCVVRAFSTITLAVVILSAIALYGIAASVPIGLLAKIPTYVLYGVALGSLAASMLILGCGSAWLGLRRRSRVAQFSVTVPLGVVLLAASWFLWTSAIWPMLRWDPGTGSGFMMFSDFVERNKSITLRRLPYVEMSELEFYSWWPMRLLLLAFVANMVVATVRRIEFKFVNLGVLMVHTGIVLIALGSVYYSALKREGDMILDSGPAPVRGGITPGSWRSGFYDGQAVAVCVRPAGGLRWLTIPTRGVPRYNDYDLLAHDELSAWGVFGPPDPQGEAPSRTLAMPVRTPPAESAFADVRMRIVGYASYGEDAVDFSVISRDSSDTRTESAAMVSMHVVEVGRMDRETGFQLTKRHFLTPDLAKYRGFSLVDGTQVDLVPRTTAESRDELAATVPDGALASLIIEIPNSNDLRGPMRASLVGEAGGQSWFVKDPLPIGETGWIVQLEDFQPKNELRLITPGYEDAESAVAVVRVVPPEGAPFRRYVYARFPEIAQDILDDIDPATGRPMRRDPHPGIRLGLIDSSGDRVHLCIDEQGHVKPIIRRRGGEVRVGPWMETAGVITGLKDSTALRLAGFRAEAELAIRPRSVPEHKRERELVGNHGSAWIGVEVTSTRFDGFRRVVWLPFNKYIASGLTTDRYARVLLPDGRNIELAFGRVFHMFHDFMIRLEDFHVEEYAHRGAPRDYQSTLSVAPHWQRSLRSESGLPIESFRPFTHVAKLNAPLRAPYNVYDTSRGVLASFFGRLVSGLDPHQFKFSQAGWDSTTWERTRAMVDRGELDRPSVLFTILQVGNNPGIHIIAFGGILMAVGIPWAFYLKPWLIRRASARIRAKLAEASATGRDGRPRAEQSSRATAEVTAS
ncbi:MAG: hypothetical protein KIT24_10940 [Phycisphaeraceae bacterium]|nr:hypothetical protein [Phycisphaeraceae bacterium]